MKAPLLVSASAVALFALPVAAQAQSSDAPPPADEATGESARPSEDIIVTATRRSERLQDVPLSVTAFGQRRRTWQLQPRVPLPHIAHHTRADRPLGERLSIGRQGHIPTSTASEVGQGGRVDEPLGQRRVVRGAEHAIGQAIHGGRTW